MNAPRGPRRIASPSGSFDCRLVAPAEFRGALGCARASTLVATRATALYDEIAAGNPTWKKAYDDDAPVRADQNLWFSVAEASLDQFTQSPRR